MSALKKLITQATFAVAALAVSTTTVLAAEYNWKFQSFWSAGSTNQQAFERFAKNVEEMSGGRIAIEVHAGGAIVPPGEMLDAVKTGILDGMNGTGAYFVGKDPGFTLVADINAGYDTPEQFTAWFWTGGGVELAREIYGKHGVYYLGPVMWGAESIPTKNPIRGVEDFKGVKMRSPEGIGAALWRKVGVGVSTLPGSEVYTALERGKIEATDWGTLGMNDELGYNKIAAYAIYPGIHSVGSADVSINMKTWKALPADLQAILVIAARELNRDSLMTNAMLDADFAAKRDSKTLINWSAEERKKLRNIAQEVWADWSEKSPMAKKIYESHIAFMTKIGLL